MSPRKTSTILVLTSVGNEEQGELIARELVGRRHAACVNMVPGVRSFYRWQGKICRDDEFLYHIPVVVSSEDLGDDLEIQDQPVDVQMTVTDDEGRTADAAASGVLVRFL